LYVTSRLQKTKKQNQISISISIISDWLNLADNITSTSLFRINLLRARILRVITLNFCAVPGGNVARLTFEDTSSTDGTPDNIENKPIDIPNRAFLGVFDLSGDSASTR